MTWPADTYFSVIAFWTAIVIWITVYVSNRGSSNRPVTRAEESQTHTQQTAPATPEVTSARRRSPRTPRTEPIPHRHAHLELADRSSRWLFYAVRIGRIQGIFHSWADCAAQVDGFPGARYQGFNDVEEALVFIGWVR